MTNKQLSTLLGLVLCVSLSSVVMADPGKDKGKPDGHKPSSGKHHNDLTMEIAGLLAAGITQREARELAVRYGVTGHKALPPGIRKNLARGKPLPPGIAKQTIPGGYRDGLPRHEGYEWQRSGTDLILVSVAADIIADVLYDVFN